MPNIIFTSRYLKNAPSAKLANLVQYIGSRKGVELNKNIDPQVPVTQRQRELILNLKQELPEITKLLEYDDFTKSQTAENASELISAVIEQNADAIADRDNFVRYMGMRPRVEKLGAHGLFSQTDEPISLNTVATEVAQHKGNVWSHVLSLRREDAERLEYNNQNAFKLMLRKTVSVLADAHKIPLENLKWYAAFHNESHHPHIHLIVYSTDISKGYLTNQGIEKLRSTYVNEIFKDELQHLYDEQTDVRNELRNSAKDIVTKLIEDMESDNCENPRVESLIAKLHHQLESTAGKKVYGYLPKSVKSTVDEIVKELASDDRIRLLYEKWMELEKDKLKNYTDRPMAPIPLEQQKEFRSIKNTIIQAALNLNHPLPDLEFEKADSYVAIMDPEPDEPDSLPSVQESGFSDYLIGKELLYGVHVPQDVEKGIGLLKQSAAQGFLAADYLLGKTYLQANLVEQDIPEAIRRLTRSAEKGNSFAAFKLGKLYISNEYQTPNFPLAEKWLTIAAQQNNSYAQYALGKLYLEEKMLNPQKAMYWLTQSALHEYSYAQLKLARLYLDGSILPKDVKEAQELLECSAEQNNGYAQYALGKLYLQGGDIPGDTEKASYWLQHSADNGNPYARQLLNQMKKNPSLNLLGTAGGLLRHLARMMQSGMDLNECKPKAMRTESKLLAEIAEKKAALGHKDGQKQR